MPKLNLKDEINLHYSIKGKGIPIIFIHPPVITSACYDYQISELSQDFQIITFDIRGHGQSNFSAQPITYKLIVEDMIALLDHLQIDRAFICGYSTGGSIALEYLLTYPERALGGILISTMPDVNDEYLRKKISIGLKLAESGAKTMLTWTIAFGNANTKEIFQFMFAEARKGDIRNMGQYLRCSLEYNCTDRLGNISHPVLLIYGKKDGSFHRYAQILHEKLPYNEIRFIDESHRIPTKSAKELNTYIKQFCSGHAP